MPQMERMECMASFFHSRASLILTVLLLMVLGALGPVKPTMETSCPRPKDDLNRDSFPRGLMFGTSSSAYQYEGAAHQDGKGTSIWDTFTHVHPEMIADGSNGDVAIDFYHRYKEDIQRTKELNVDAFRFSIAWSRILPYGSVSGGINQKGINFYNNLIDEAMSNGLVPFVTIFHWDTPQALQDKYDGFLSPMIVKDFEDYANICFEAFGDRVKHWITINEPRAYCNRGHDQGDFAPGRCSAWVNGCKHGNSATEPYIVSHNMLLAHAAAVRVYREKYQARQNGEIGLTLNSYWYEPYSNSAADIQAARRALDFMYGWFMNPVIYGDYPKSMRELVGDRLPNFTAEQSMKVKGSYDFIGINYYSSFYAADTSHAVSDPNHMRYQTDSHVHTTSERNGIPIGLKAASSWLNVYPEGIRYLLNYTKDTYKNPTIYITENGYDEFRYSRLSLEESLDDRCRIKYYNDHLRNVLESMKDYDVQVKGFFLWSLADNFEWESGYNLRFGLYYIDYENDLKRYPKRSVEWLKEFLKRKSSVDSSKKKKSSVDDGFIWSRPFGFSFKNPARSEQYSPDDNKAPASR